MTEFEIQCPGCGSQLRLQDQSLLGKTLSCPKCNQLFAADVELPDAAPPAIVPPADPVNIKVEAPPARQTASPPKSTAPPKPARIAKKDPRMLIAGGVAVAILVLALGAWGSGAFRGKPKAANRTVAAKESKNSGRKKKTPPKADVTSAADQPIGAPAGTGLDLAWLPPDAEVFLRLRPAKLLKSDLLRDFRDSKAFPPDVGAVFDEAGLRPADIDDFLVGSTNAAELMPDTTTSRGGYSAVIVCRLLKPLDVSKSRIAGQPGTATEYAGKTYFRFPASWGGAAPFGVYPHSPTLLVMGDESAIKGAIDRGETAGRRPELDFIDADRDVLLAIVPRDRRAVVSTAKSAIANLPNSAWIEDSLDSVAGFCLGASLNREPELQVTAVCDTPDAATELCEGTERMLSAGRESFASIKRSLPLPIGTNLEQALQSTKLSLNGKIARLTASLPKLEWSEVTALAGSMPAGGTGGSTSETDEDNIVKPRRSGAGVAAANGGELPVGLKLTARAEWQRFGRDAEGIEFPANLSLKVYLGGQMAEFAANGGRLQIDSLETDPPLRLKRRRRDNTYAIRTDKLMFPIDSSANPTLMEGPLIPMEFERTEPTVKTIRRIAGTFQFDAGGQTQIFTIKNVLDVAREKRPVPELQKFEIQLQAEPKVLVLSTNHTGVIKDVEPLDADGKPNRRVQVQDNRFVAMVDDGPLPPDLAVKITAVEGVKSLKAPFVFENIRVPDAPPLSAAQGQLLNWQQPINNDEIPSDLIVEGIARWQEVYSKEGKLLPCDLRFTLDITGPRAARIAEFGELTLDVVPDNGVKLERKWQGSDYHDVGQVMIRQQSDDRMGEAPVGGIETGLVFANPGRPTARIESVEGSVKLKIAREQKVVTIRKIPGLGDRSLALEQLTVAGLAARVNHSTERSLTLVVDEGDIAAIQDVRVIDADGREIQWFARFHDDKKNLRTVAISIEDESLLKDASLEITLNLGLETISVPLRFENVTVPREPRVVN